MLIKNRSMLIPISIEFRKCLIQETIFQLKITIDQIQNSFKNKSSSTAQNSSEIDTPEELKPKKDIIPIKMLNTESEILKLQPEFAKTKGPEYNIHMKTVKNNLKKKDEEKDLLENK